MLKKNLLKFLFQFLKLVFQIKKNPDSFLGKKHLLIMNSLFRQIQKMLFKLILFFQQQII